MKKIRIEEAVNCVCCHDMTKIVPGEFKGRAYQRGHVITKEDLPELRRLGKEHIYVWEETAGRLHEDEAALKMARAATGAGVDYGQPSEGKVMLQAQDDGLCVVDETRLKAVNLLPDVMIATRSNFRLVKKGEVVAGLRAIPLVVEQSRIEQVEGICAGGIISVLPLKRPKIGIVTTGNEVYHGLIQDRFGPFLQAKLAEYGCTVAEQVFCPDDAAEIARAIRKLIGKGAELILTTGGMSVDPDDVTPLGIRQAGATVVTHGTPILPGAMLLVAYLGERAILGLPGGVMFSKVSALDLLLPFVLADVAITKERVAGFGLGGLCLHCAVCHYPNCTFGIGV